MNYVLEPMCIHRIERASLHEGSVLVDEIHHDKVNKEYSSVTILAYLDDVEEVLRMIHKRGELGGTVLPLLFQMYSIFFSRNIKFPQLLPFPMCRAARPFSLALVRFRRIQLQKDFQLQKPAGLPSMVMPGGTTENTLYYAEHMDDKRRNLP